MAISANNAKLYQKLKKSSDEYRNLIEGASDSISSVDLKGNITYCNKATEILTGHTKEELIGKHFSRVGSINNKDLPSYSKLFKQLLRGKKVTPFEMQVIRKDGKLCWIEVNVSRIKAKGKVAGFQVNAIDITARRRAEKELIRNERVARERAQLLTDLRNLNRIDEILTGICETVRDSGLFERAVMTLHKPGGRIIHLGQVGLPSNVVKRARQAPPIDDKLRSRITNKKFRISDSFFVPAEASLDYTKTKRYIPQKKKNSSGGDWQPGDELFVPLWSSPGEIMGYLSVDTPTDGCRPDLKTIQALEMLVEAAAARVREVETREALSESEEKFRILAEQSPNMIFINKKGRVIYANAKCQEVMGYKKEEFYSPNFDFFVLIAPEYRKLVKASFARHIMGKEVDPYEYAIITREGKKIEAILSTKLISYYGENAVLGIITDITARKRAEEEIRKFKTISDRARYGSAISDLEGNLIYMNESFAQMHGYKAEELIGKNLSIFHTKEQMKDVERFNKQLIQKGSYIAEEVWHKRKEGTVFLTLMSLTTVEDEKGKPLFMAATAIDITDRKQAEENLRLSEEKFAKAFNASPSAVFITTLKEGRFIEINKSGVNMFGYEPEEIVGRTVKELHLWADLGSRDALIHSLYKEGVVHNMEIKLCRKSGEVFNALISVDVIDIDGERCLLSIASDIAERKQAEEALKESENRYRNLIESALDIIYTFSPDGIIASLNPAFETITGWEIKDWIGKSFTDLIHPEEISPVMKLIQESIAGKEHPRNEFRLLKKTGDYVPLDFNANPLIKDGKLIGFVGIARDITERKQAEEALHIERERLETVTQNVGVGLAIISKDYRTLWANEVLKQIFGDVEGEICYSTYNQRTEICQGCGVREVFETGRHEVIHEQVGKDKYGKTIWSQIVATPIKDEEGNVTAALEVVVDITERKRTEEALRGSEKRYRTLFEDSPISIWEEDFSEVKKFIDGLQVRGVKDFRKYFEDHPKAVVNCANRVRVIDVNNASLELFKAKSKEELQRGLGNTFSEESYDAFRETLIAVTQGKTTFIMEAIAQTLKGDKKHVVVRWSVAPGYEKTLAKVLVSIGDITEIKRAQEQNLLLETSKALSRTLKLDQVLKIATEKMAEALKPDRCSVALFDEKEDSALLKYLVTKKDSPSTLLLDKRTPPDDHFSEVKEVLMTKGYLKIANVKTDPLPPPIKNYFIKTQIKSSLIIPIIAGKNLFGAFHLVSEKLRDFVSEEIALAQTIANQAAVVLQNCILMEDLERKHRQISEQADLLRTQYNEQKMLFELGQALSSTRDLDQMLKFATQKVTELLKTERSSILLINPDKESATIKALYTQGKSPRPDVLGFTFDSKAFPVLKKMLTRPEPLFIPDTSALPRDNPLRAYFLRRVKMKSTVAVALQSREKLLGFLTAGTVKEVHHYTPEEIQLLQTVANSIAVTIENSVLLGSLKENYAQIDKQAQTLKRQAEEREILLKISRELSGTLDLDRILEIATKEAAHALQVDRCAAALAFPEEGYAEIRFIYVKGDKSVTHLLGYKLYPHNLPQAKEMFNKRKAIHIPNIYHLSDKSFAKEYFIKEGIKSVIFSPMVHGKKLAGFFVLSTMEDFKTFTKEEIKLAQAIADQVAVAIENARLLELLRKTSEDLKTLSLQLINVQEDERKKIAQELHDEVGQTLFAMKMNLEMTKKNLPSNLDEAKNVETRLNDTENLLSQTIERIRNLTTDLRPSMLDDFGLIPALNWYIDNFYKRTNIKVYLKTKNFKPRLSSEVETSFYRIIQEALTNVAKHSRATEVSILLAQKNSFASLSVEDNGIGFDTEKITFPKDRLGLFGIKERVEVLHGEFEISSKPNKGTKLNVKIPLVEKRV